MKIKSKVILAALSGLMIYMFTACTQTADKNYAVVQGKWQRGKEDKVSLYQVISGRLDEIASFNLTDGREFTFAVPVKKENFYVIGDENPLANSNKYVVYLKANDEVNIEVSDSTYALAGDNTPENKALEEWHNFVYPMERRSIYGLFSKTPSTYVDFFPLLIEKEKELKTTKFGGTSNPVFENAFAEYRKFDFLSIAVGFNFMPHPAHPEKEDFIDFYREIDIDELTSNCKILEYPFGKRLLSQLFFFNQEMKFGTVERNYEKWIKNDTLIGEMCLDQLRQLKSFQAYLEFEKEYEKYILNDDQKKRLEEVKLKLAENNKEGQPAIDFTYPDINGKNVSLSGLKGKVVVIDVWATWCGPCKKEIPHLKKMEEEYHSKDVVFLSVSIDEEKDKQKWVDFVKKEELKGVQLFAGGWTSDVVKYYGIKGIPRFMVVGKDGNLVSIDAPRPSTPELGKMIDAELKK